MSDKGKRKSKKASKPKGKGKTPTTDDAARIRKKIGKLAKGFAKGIAPPEGGAHHHDMSSARTFVHGGRKCVIKTHYEITVDGEALGGHLAVDERGRVHHHGLPNYSFPSAVDLVKAVLDASKHELEGEDELASIYDRKGS